MKISFDFDQTLDSEPMQILAAKMISSGVDVWVTTARPEKARGIVFDNKDLFEVTDRLGIGRKQIQFTNYAPKSLFLKEFDLHFDDSWMTINEINTAPIKCVGVQYMERAINKKL